MKIYIDAKELTYTLKSLNWTGKISMPVLECAFLNADENGITISRTNLDIHLSLKLQGNIQETGQCLVPVKKTLAVLKNCKGEIPLEFDGGEYLKVGDYLLDTMPVDNYPLCPDEDKEESFSNVGDIQGHVLAYAIKKTAPWKSNKLRESLDHFCLKNGQLCASDGRVLLIAETGLKYDQQLTINDSLGLLHKIDLEGDIQVALSEEWLFLKGGNFKAFVRLMEDIYPNFESVMPSKAYPLKVDGQTLIDGLKEAIAYAKAVTKDKDIPIYLQWLENRIEIYGNYGENKKFRKVIADYNGQFPVSLKLNAVWLLEAIKDWQGELTIWHSGENKPILITDGATYKYIQAVIRPEKDGDGEIIDENYYPLPEDAPMQEIPYSPDISAVPKPSKKAKKSTAKKTARSSKKASQGKDTDKALSELKAKADFWEAEALKKEEHIRNMEVELAKLQEAYRVLLQFQALRPNGKGRYAFIDGRQYLFSQGKILDEDGNEIGHYTRKGGEINGHPFNLQQEWVLALN